MSSIAESDPASAARSTRIRWAIALSIFLFALNAWICRELFTADFIPNLLSNEGAFASFGRFFREHPLDYQWFPWFNAGMPIENAYQPLLPVFTAIINAFTGWPASRALHAVLAFAYCCGPVTLFWLAWDWSRSIPLSLSAALAFTLTSPAEMLVPELRFGVGSHWGPLRLHDLVWYGEAPHNVALAMLPLALLFLHRAIVRGGAWNTVLAGVMSGAVALSNAFGAFGVALCAFSMVLALGRGVRRVLVVGVCSYCWVSPWLPPSLIALIRRNAWSAGGFFEANIRAYIAILAATIVFVILWFLTRPLKSSFVRFALLFGVWMCAIPLCYFWLRLTIVPQSSRYQLELEMALCLLFGCAFERMWRLPPARFASGVRIAIVAIAAIVCVRQARIYRQAAAPQIQPIDITKTIEYKVDTWINRNLPGQRTMISGDPEYIFNLFSDNPQLSSGHEPTAPNWMQQVAVYAIYTGANAGDRDAEYSIFWLKAFGNQAIYVPGPASREHYHPIVHPHKFDGILPVLWHEEDDTIFGVPQRSRSLAHVIPSDAVVVRQPLHGLDIEPARAYVAALDDTSLPLADLTWLSPSHGVIRTSMNPNQVISVEETYMAGWQARVAGRNVSIHGDKLGLIVIDPHCNGPCQVDLSFGVTPEGWICRALSAIVTLAAIGSLAFSRRSRSSVPSVRNWHMDA